jgi:hypothetical protein
MEVTGRAAAVRMLLVAVLWLALFGASPASTTAQDEPDLAPGW